MRVNTTGENILVESVIGLTQVSVRRAVGGTSAQAIAAAVNIYSIGNAYEEASLRPQSLIINPVRITNLTQIFRNTWAMSDTIRATQMIAGDSNVAESSKIAACSTLLILRKLCSGAKSIKVFVMVNRSVRWMV
jgi:hypothetical protein